MRNKSGFTLIEILVAMTIIAVVFTVVLTSYLAAQRNARNAQRLTDLESIRSALEQYYADQKYYPATLPLAQSSPITNQVGAASPTPATTVTYLKNVPTEPTQSDFPYCYIAANLDESACTNSLCQYYLLYTNLEGSTTNAGTCGSKTYNTKVTPP